MANGLNVCVFSGNLTKAPEVRMAQASGEPVAKFTIAVNQGWGDNAYAEFVDCVAFKKTAQVVADWATKGTKVEVVTRLKTQRWETPEGQKRSRPEFVVEQLQLLGGKSDSQGSQQGQSGPSAHEKSKQDGYQKQPEQSGAGEDPGDIPFMYSR